MHLEHRTLADIGLALVQAATNLKRGSLRGGIGVIRSAVVQTRERHPGVLESLFLEWDRGGRDSEELVGRLTQELIFSNSQLSVRDLLNEIETDQRIINDLIAEYVFTSFEDARDEVISSRHHYLKRKNWNYVFQSNFDWADLEDFSAEEQAALAEFVLYL